MKLAFLGLGVMGYPMAGHLANAGHSVVVYNRTAEKAAQWLTEYTGEQAATPAEAAQNADIVLSCVGNDDDVRQITLGEQGAFAAMQAGSIFIDHTTTSAIVARELYEAAQKRGFHFLDAPVSGGQAGAENGALTIMLGGDQTAFETAKPVMNSYARMLKLLGGAGSGQLTKMVNQICLTGLIQALAEAIHFAKAAELNVSDVIEVISKGAAQSWQMDNRAETMIAGQYDFGFAVDWMRKDLGFVKDEAKRNGANLQIVELVDQFYAEVQNMGGGRWDTSSLMARLEKPA